MSVEEKLQLVFSQHFQVKRVSKQIALIRQNRQKYSYQPRTSFVRGQSVTFCIEYQKDALKKFKKTKNITKFEIKILIKKDYPATAPLVFCMSESMIDLGFQPFRDYSPYLTVDWTAKDTIMDIVKFFPQFIQKWGTQYQIKKGRYLMNETFQTQKVFSWSFLQIFPVKFIHDNNSSLNGFLIINCKNQIICLQEAGSSGTTYVTKDLIKISQVVSIFKSKQQSAKILIQVRKNNELLNNQNKINQKKVDKSKSMCFAFLSDDRENVVNSIIEYVKINISLEKQRHQNEDQQNQGLSQEQQDEESQQDEDYLEGDFKEGSPAKIDIQAIKQEIVLYESLVQSQMTSQNISNLVVLLKKAIQYYSAIGKQDFEIYLKKLKTIMNNQMAQVLLDSVEQNKKKQENRINQIKMGKQDNTQIFKSIVDLL